ncbi:hypothetical protein GGTG_00191 [Gaeumannomyces tritici R3-111a-1]|uniref:Extracellular membrane protein CFEM domain-containing protein n=1 Tax=Gaeumannomyces tritici (strain R3-111a-1) TaxID=644352 RepID=J3NFZ8_GAET3|nr:hypothetical protein GGTG_00191 [Gaeumannomyces tritici R3-111a-1]EJT80188.1 hypothetical protein GGTG_00191 [Gaeumannomyces tritici R3-111a-1]
MKFFLLPLAFAASLAAAQSSACGADYILEACLTTENAKFAACSEGDWDCKCSSYNNIMTCFNNCPNDLRRETQQGQQKIFCGYASQFPSKTAGVAKSSAASGGAAAATTTPASGASNTASSTTGAASPAKTNGAATDLAMNAGGVLALVAAVVAAAM